MRLSTPCADETTAACLNNSGLRAARVARRVSLPQGYDAAAPVRSFRFLALKLSLIVRECAVLLC